MPSSFDFAGAARMTGSITVSPRVTAICQRPLSPLGGLDHGAQGELVAAGLHLERHDQGVAAARPN